MKINELIENFKQHNSSYSKLNEYYLEPSFLEILGVDRKEVVHSQFLAWIFKLEKDKNGLTPIFLLLNYLFKASTKEIKFDVNDVELISVETEKGGASRIDILLKVKVLDIYYTIIIENKVYTKEHNQQTQRYVLEHQTKSNPLFYYLVSATNKNAKRKNYPDIHQNFVIINYQGLLDHVISKLKYLESQTQFIIDEYIKSLSKSWRYFKSNNKNNHNVMALNQEHRELLNNFWEDNKELIILSLQAIAEDDGFDSKAQKEVQETVDLLKAHQEKQKEKYILEIAGKRSESFLLVDVVRHVLEFTRENVKLNDEIFKYFLDNSNYNSYPLVTKKGESFYKKNQSRYGTKDNFFYKIEGNKTKYACLRNWGTNNISNFKEMLKTKFNISLKNI